MFMLDYITGVVWIKMETKYRMERILFGYFKPTDERYEGIERLFRYDFNDDQIVNGKAWKEPKFCTSCGLRKGEMINPVQTPRLGPSRPSYDELADLVQDHRLVFVSKQSANTEGLSNELTL